MDFNDFLIEYDLTPEQKKLAARLKAAANLRQLINSLGDHALFFSREVLARQRASKSSRSGGQTTSKAARRKAGGSNAIAGDTDALRKAVIQWFESLDLPQRMAVLTCSDACWVRTALQMSRLRGEVKPEQYETIHAEGRFRVLAQSPPKGAAGAQPVARNAGTTSSRGARDPVVQYRRAHRLPDGDLIVPVGAKTYFFACDAIATGIRVAFRGRSCSSLALEWGAVMPSPRLVANFNKFLQLADEVSLGRFLKDARDPLRPSKLPWTDAAWLEQWGSHFPFSAFLVSRLEMLMLQGFAGRDSSPLQAPLELPLADVLATMPKDQRVASLRRVGRNLLRRLLSETLATNLGEFGSHFEPPRCLSDLFWYFREFSKGSDEDFDEKERWFLQQSPLEIVASVTTAALPAATRAPDAPMKDLLLQVPRIWLHQQFAEELAIVCSEHSANSLLNVDVADREEDVARCSKRSEKRQRQKLRRKQAGAARRAVQVKQEAVVEEEGEDEVAIDASEESPDAIEQVTATSVPKEAGAGSDQQEIGLCQSERREVGVSCSRGCGREVAIQAGTVDAEVQANQMPPYSIMQTGQSLGRLGGVLDDWDGHTSELSSIGVPTSRSESLCDSGGRGRVPHFALRNYVEDEWLRARRRPGHPGRRWHDDSRLEFLLRNRDRFQTELEWDRMSHCSVPASLDEAALYPVGLETRFAYLFDSPARSRVTTALGSQAAAEEDAQRLGAPWDDMEEWQSLTTALEKLSDEREMWKAKAHELENRLANNSGTCLSHGGAASISSAEACANDDVPTLTPVLGPSNLVRGNSTPTGPSRRSNVDEVSASMNAKSERQFADPWVSRARVRNLHVDESGSDVAGGVPQSFSEDLGVSRSLSLPGLGIRGLQPSLASNAECGTNQVGAVRIESSRSPSPPSGSEVPSSLPMRGHDARKRALHATWDARQKKSCCNAATQTAPAITLSKMYGGMVPRYVQRELARLRQESQILRYRIASLAMSQPIGRPRPMRDQATQTAPALTFSTARQQGSGPMLQVSSSIPRLPRGRQMAGLRPLGPKVDEYTPSFDPGGVPSERVRRLVDASIIKFVRAAISPTYAPSSNRGSLEASGLASAIPEEESEADQDAQQGDRCDDDGSDTPTNPAHAWRYLVLLSLARCQASWKLWAMCRGADEDEKGDIDLSASVDAGHWREFAAAKRQLQEDMFQSISGPLRAGLPVPMPVHAQIPRISPPQPWETVSRYGLRLAPAGTYPAGNVSNARGR